jgi:hypothetical protein
VQGQAVGFHPRFDFFQCRPGFFRRGAQNHEVVGF